VRDGQSPPATDFRVLCELVLGAGSNGAKIVHVLIIEVLLTIMEYYVDFVVQGESSKKLFKSAICVPSFLNKLIGVMAELYLLYAGI
jgi:hypothetical protein